ncbi:MAG: YbfB/YjiJ family MFS transporter [Burkholderiaceae bacterium]|nr:YbfB/YjiJ family MFS transporter [Burkholderiaceae bacterium]
MGIGRFAFTPILPMMLHDKVIDLPGASWLASANYLGYLVGALLCTAQPWIWRRIPNLPRINAPLMVRGGLTATIIFTTGMSLNESSLWPPLRFASGVASAFVFVYASSWCLAQLARRGVANMGGLIYVGPGAGIVASGLLASAMVSAGWPSGAAWMIFGLLALVLTAVILPKFRVQVTPPGAVPAGATHAAPAQAPVVNLPTGRGEVALLTFSYGLAGFGYIITATFLPVIARQAIPGSAWLDLFWPLFGTGVMLGAIIASRIPSGGDNRLLLAGCYFVQAAGIGIGIVSPSAAGFALGSLLLGLPFTAITFFAMQEVRRIRAASAPSYMGLLTALYGIGQIVGPPLVAVLLRHSATAGEGFALSLEIAAGALVVGGAIFAGMARVYAMK